MVKMFNFSFRSMELYNIYRCECQKCGKGIMKLLDLTVCGLSAERLKQWSCHECKKTFFTSLSCIDVSEGPRHSKHEKENELNWEVKNE